MKKKRILVAVDNIRTPEQVQQMKDVVRTGKGPFCEIDWEHNRLVKEGEYWYLIHNRYPYPNHDHHLLLISKRHINSPSKLTRAERLEWFKLNLFAIRKFKIPGGAIVMRFGDLSRSGGTIAHLHSHLQVPNLSGDSFAIAVFKMNPALQQFLSS